MKRSILLPLAVFLLIAATGGGLYLAQPNTLAARVKQLESELSKAQSENVQLKSDNEKLQEERKASVQASQRGAGTPRSMLAGAASPSSPNESSGTASQPGSSGGTQLGGDKARAAESIRKIDVPKMLDTLAGVHDQRIDTTYGRLFKQLGLNAEEQDYFRKLLADRQRKQTELTFQQANASLERPRGTPAPKRSPDEAANDVKESDAAIRQFLNSEEDFQTFKQWDGAKSERYDMQMLAGSLDAAGEPLAPDQREQLLNAIISARKTITKVPPGTPKPQGAMTYQLIRDAQNQKILEEAAKFMTPEQLAATRRAQQVQQNILRIPSSTSKK